MSEVETSMLAMAWAAFAIVIAVIGYKMGGENTDGK